MKKVLSLSNNKLLINLLTLNLKVTNFYCRKLQVIKQKSSTKLISKKYKPKV